VTIALLAVYDVPGAAIGTSFGYVLLLAMTAYAYARISGNAIYDALMPRRSDVRLYTDAVSNFFRRLRGLPVPPTPLPSESES
jgi:hypothetical protein